ncbi:hypothetical protein SK803_27590 [Lentzea sp. BCCO 10_0856]|uniref:Excreted virulence factor EspC, type VII ESX diderm n=1 Tax=Lentzea miocenica TaxID=3095431 RepID=A0ABU4T781_9PSEU|nr:hypothetical protein [Lentzea sp. BCCO 10_0856]MDX8034001.1 hypothetical protein [Lentzea sp. BCCO 10_0856]
MLMFDALVPIKTGAAAGAAAGAALGAAGSGVTRFSVDPGQAQKMIDGLKAAVEHLSSLRNNGLELQQSGAPGPDPYSGMATLAMREAAGEQPGGYLWANDLARKALEKTIENIEKALAEYRGTDDAAKSAMKG